MIARNNKVRRLLGGTVLLLALLFRAAVPVGFMPSGESLFALKVCPEGLRDAHAAHAHHGQGHGHFESCPFGAVPAAGPLSTAVGSLALPPALAEAGTQLLQSFRVTRLARAHAPRAPPSLLN